MKLNELNLDGYKHIMRNNWQIPDNLIMWLTDKNFELVGDGNFSTVWISNDCDFVVKTGKTKDTIFKKFVNYCHAANDRHLPKFGTIKNLDENTFVVFMEKLYHVEFNNSLALFLREYSKFLAQNNNMDYKKSIQEFFNKENIPVYDLIYLIKDWLYDEKNINIKGKNFEYSMQMDSLTETVYNATITMKQRLDDIGGSNIMQREDGTLVLSDPIYG